MPKIIFILNEPAVAENIGFSIRALKTMGFSEMRIIYKSEIDYSKLKKTAYGSHDLLDTIKPFTTLKEALNDIDLKVGTTAKSRTLRKDYISIKELSNNIKGKGDTINSIGMVFGSEENGLSTEDLKLCDLVTFIPLKVSYPSLNLAQAVLIYAYELAELKNDTENNIQFTESEYKIMIEKSVLMLEKLEINEDQVIYQRIKDRLALASGVDIRMILSVLNRMNRKLEQNNVSKN